MSVTGRADRIAVFVDDLEATAADLENVFGMQFTTVDVDVMGVKVALSDEGIELLQWAGADPTGGATAANGRLAGVCVRGDDAEAAIAKLAEAGFLHARRVETPGGLHEYSYAGFHGFPLVVYAYGDEGFVRGSLGDYDAAEPYVPTVVPGPGA